MITLPNVSLGLLYLLFFTQYVQPQVLLHLPKQASPFLIVSMLLMGTLLFNRKFLSCLQHKQIRWMIVLIAWFTLLVPVSSIITYSVIILKTFSIQIIFMIAVVILIDTQRKFKWLISFMVLVTLLLIVMNGVQQGEFRRNAESTLPNFLTDPNDLSLFLNMMIPWMILCCDYNRGLLKKFFALGILAAVLMDLLTFSRGGMMGLVAISIMLMIFHPQRYKIMLVESIVVIVGLIVLSSTDWFEVMGTTSISSNTAQQRLALWSASWEIFKAHPMGSGLASIGSLAYLYIPDGLLGYGKSHWQGLVAHSFWFTALTEWGIFGFGILLYLIKTNIKDCRRMIRLPRGTYLHSIGVAGITSIAGFLTSATFLTANYFPHFYYLTALICAASAMQYRRISC